ncbi:MAG TPA: hypothetical protein VFO16_12700, partial [Pseudonocardiaceae bacterium]|nr:hypothetical protein [Pseudonocardiaceae bacterium]
MKIVTIDNQTEAVREVATHDRLVTPQFSALAEFAGFGQYEAVAVQETGEDISVFIDRMPAQIYEYLMTRPESAPLMGGSAPSISVPLIQEWLNRTIAGPYDGSLASFLREICHLEAQKVTFPG